MVLTQSRGGIGALVLAGITLLTCKWGARRWGRPWLWRIACLVPIVGIPVAVWGLGEQSLGGNLVLDTSLAVRGWHLETAKILWVKEPIIGAGPGGFQEKYMVHKNPLSPENVADPHNIIASWIASLGLGGIAWSLLLIWMVWKATALLWMANKNSQPSADGETDGLALVPLGVVVLLCATQYSLQVKEQGPEMALAWLLGAVGAVITVLVMCRQEVAAKTYSRYGVLLAVLGVTIHSQIDISMSDPMAAPLLMSIVGLGAAMTEDLSLAVSVRSADPGSTRQQSNSPLSHREVIIGWGLISLVGILTIVLLFMFVLPFSRAAAEIRLAVKEALADNPQRAMKHLEKASQGLHTDPRPFYLGGVISMQEASVSWQAGKMDVTEEFFKAAFDRWDKAEQLGSRRAFLCRRKAELAARLFAFTGKEEWKQRALNEAGKALSMDPYNRYGAIKMADLAGSLGFCEEASKWYKQALRMDDFLTVLPALRFSEKERSRVQEKLRGLKCHNTS